MQKNRLESLRKNNEKVANDYLTQTGDKKRVKQGIFYGTLYIEVIMLVGIIGLKLFAEPLIGLFAMSAETESLCILATRIIAAGFLFAGGNIAIQGVFQALGCGISSLVVSVL